MDPFGIETMDRNKEDPGQTEDPERLFQFRDKKRESLAFWGLGLKFGTSC